MREDEIAVDFRERDGSIDTRLAAEEVIVERSEVLRQALAKLRNVSRGQRESACELVTAEMREQPADRGELLVKVDRRDAAARADGLLTVDRDREGGPIALLRDASGRESEDAFVPLVAGQDEDALAARNLPRRNLADLALDLLAFRVEAIELGADRPRLVIGRRGEELNGSVRGREPARGIDARTDLEADISRAKRPARADRGGAAARAGRDCACPPARRGRGVR